MARAAARRSHRGAISTLRGLSLQPLDSDQRHQWSDDAHFGWTFKGRHVLMCLTPGGGDSKPGALVMCDIPMDLERRFERRWAARFSGPAKDHRLRGAASTGHRARRKQNPPARNRKARKYGPEPAPSVGALRLILRSIAHDLHVAVRIVASFDFASVREPNEGRCGGNECAFVEDRVDLASAAPFVVDYGDRLVVNLGRFRHRIDPRTN